MRTPLTTGMSAAIKGKANPTPTCINKIHAGGVSDVISKLIVPAIKLDMARAPMIPAGTAMTKAKRLYTSTMTKYIMAICMARAPIAFMMPIWRTCCVMTAAMVLMTKKPLSNSAKKPNTDSTNEIACNGSAPKCLPGPVF